MPRTLTFEYDPLYRKTTDVDDAAPGTPIASWSYFGPIRVAEVRLGNGLVSTFLNDVRSNSSVQPAHGANPVVPTPSWGNANTDRVGYDATARVITKRYVQSPGSSSSSSSSSGGSQYGPLVAGFTTAYDKASNKNYERLLHAESRSSLYAKIDSVNRLGKAVRGVLAAGTLPGAAVLQTPNSLPGTEKERTYKLDHLGNWQRTTAILVDGDVEEKQVRHHNALNQITSVKTLDDDILSLDTTFTYDKNGNLLDDGMKRFEYDAFNRLVRVKRKSDSEVIALYVYDAASRRIRKQIQNGGLSGDLTNTTTDYLFASDRVMEERNVNDETSKQYVWGRYVDELIQQRNYEPSGGAEGGTDYYMLSDMLYRANALTDANGTIVEAYDEDVFGQTRIYSGPDPISGDWFTDDDVPLADDTFPRCEVLFTGQRFDAETGLYCYRNRTYNPGLGRFLQRDPVGYSIPVRSTELFEPSRTSVDSLNTYQYVLGSPARWLDAYGTDLDSTQGGGGGGGTGGGGGGGTGGGGGGGTGGGGQTTGNTTWCQQHPYLCVYGSFIDGIAVGFMGAVLIGAMITWAATAPLWGVLLVAVVLTYLITETINEVYDIAHSPPSVERDARIAFLLGTLVGGRLARSSWVPRPAPSYTRPPGTASDFEGSRRAPIQVRGNPRTTIGGRPYSGHAIDRMQGRGIPPSVVENTIQTSRGVFQNETGTILFEDPVNRVSVAVDPVTGRVVTTCYH